MAKKKNPVPDETYQLRGEQKPIEATEEEVNPGVEESEEKETNEEWDKGGPLVNNASMQEDDHEDTIETLLDGYASKVLETTDKDKVVEILKDLIKAAKGKVTRRATGDPIKRIEEMTTIEEVRSALKVAYAKKSKAKDNPESLSRYELEISVAKKKLNQLLASAQSNPQMLKDMGEEVTRILQTWIIDKESALKQRMKDMNAMTDKDNLTKASKSIMTNMSSILPESLKIELEAIDSEAFKKFEDRLRRGDKRVENIVKMQNFTENVKIIESVE